MATQPSAPSALQPARAATILSGAQASMRTNGRVIVPMTVYQELEAAGLIRYGDLDWRGLERIARD